MGRVDSGLLVSAEEDLHAMIDEVRHRAQHAVDRGHLDDPGLVFDSRLHHLLTLAQHLNRAPLRIARASLTQQRPYPQ